MKVTAGQIRKQLQEALKAMKDVPDGADVLLALGTHGEVGEPNPAEMFDLDISVDANDQLVIDLTYLVDDEF